MVCPTLCPQFLGGDPIVKEECTINQPKIVVHGIDQPLIYICLCFFSIVEAVPVCVSKRDGGDEYLQMPKSDRHEIRVP